MNKDTNQIHNVNMRISSRNNNRRNDVWGTSLTNGASHNHCHTCILPITRPLNDLYCDFCILFLPLSVGGSLKIRRGNFTMHFPPLWNWFWLFKKLKVCIFPPFVGWSTSTFWVYVGLRWVNDGFCDVNLSQELCEKTQQKFATGFASCIGLRHLRRVNDAS